MTYVDTFVWPLKWKPTNLPFTTRIKLDITFFYCYIQILHIYLTFTKLRAQQVIVPESDAVKDVLITASRISDVYRPHHNTVHLYGKYDYSLRQTCA